MESKLLPLGPTVEQDFNEVTFEKKLLQLKDSQESINALSAWCLEHRQHHKKIVTAWLNVLKKVKVEQRLTLFYLANDVIQYSKRKSYDFVGSWGTTLQKATTMVREEKVKHKILRIFKIWEQRGVYTDDFISDLCGLISASTIPQKPDANQEFQPTYLITRIRSCAKLEENTDLKLKQLKDGSPKITDIDSLMISLKDRRHVEDVEREVEDGISLIEGYVNALKSEIKSRTHLISILTQAETFYHTERGEVKVVTNAYKNFSTRVKNLKKKLDELIPTLSSPIPSPDVNAPSPEPDSDIELQNSDLQNSTNLNNSLYNISNDSSVYPIADAYNVGYYNPVQESQSSSFNTSSFSSFMNSSNVPFNIQNLYSDTTSSNANSSYLSTNSDHVSPEVTPVGVTKAVYEPYHQTPLEPPPMPPFTTSGYMDSSYNDSYNTSDTYANSAPYNPITTTSSYSSTASYIPTSDAYNPEEEVEAWEPEVAWDQPPDLETPESPPIFEKEGFSDPIEYDDSKHDSILGEKDVDHRVLIPPPIPPQLTDCDIDHRLPRSNSKDVDHRNLISLTGSPGNDTSRSSTLQPPPAPPELWTGSDQDYRPQLTQDQDYRIQENVLESPPNIIDIAQQLQLPPPPPPPPPNKSPKQKKTFTDNVESIDMDLSDDEEKQEEITLENSAIEENITGPLIIPPENDIKDDNMPWFNGRPQFNKRPPDFRENNHGQNNFRGPDIFQPPETSGLDHFRGPNNDFEGPNNVFRGPKVFGNEEFSGQPEFFGHDEDFPPPDFHDDSFRGRNFRGRGHFDKDHFRGRGHFEKDHFRGRGNRRGFRGMRGMNNWGPNRGFQRGNRGFRGQFRGGF